MTIYLSREQGVAAAAYIKELLEAGRLPDLIQIQQPPSSPRKNHPVAVRVLNGNNRILDEAYFKSSGERLK